MTQPEALRLADELERVAEYDHQVQAAAELRRLYELKHPRQWQGLTDDEIVLICGECAASHADDIRYARAIEAKLKEKNT